MLIVTEFYDIMHTVCINGVVSGRQDFQRKFIIFFVNHKKLQLNYFETLFPFDVKFGLLNVQIVP